MSALGLPGKQQGWTRHSHIDGLSSHIDGLSSHIDGLDTVNQAWFA